MGRTGRKKREPNWRLTMQERLRTGRQRTETEDDKAGKIRTRRQRTDRLTLTVQER